MNISILRSRSFWMTVSDVLFSTLVYFVTKYAVPEIGNDIIWLIGAYQPIFIALITAFTVQDVALMRIEAEKELHKLGK